jgi:hypothetical protein
MKDLLLLKFQASHFDEILSNFCYSLLAFVDQKVWPVYEFIIYLSE